MGNCLSDSESVADRRDEIYRRYAGRAQNQQRNRLGPYFGEYRCGNCGRSWCSRLSWADSYQVCKRCRCHIIPFNQRELRKSDHSNERKASTQDHIEELCGMCNRLGYYCGNIRK